MQLRLWVSALVLVLVMVILGVVSGAGADTASPNYGTSLGHSISSAENTKTVTEDEYNAIKTMQYIDYFASFLLPGYSAGYSSAEKSVKKDSNWNNVIIGWSETFLDAVAPQLHAGKFYWILNHPTWPGSYGVIPPEYQSSSGSSSEKTADLKKELEKQGVGTPQLSSSTLGTSWSLDQNIDGTDVPETSGVSYFDQANDVWYIDAYSWTGDKSLYDKPAAPRRFVSGELNTYGYNWVYLPFSQTGMTYDQGYLDWVTETLASMGQSAPSAGYGLLIDEGQSGGGDW